MPINTLLLILKKQFQDLYQDQLEEIILFGSQARQQATPDSDIDIAIILKGTINPVQEIKKNNPWISDLCLETDALINCLYLSAEQFQTKETPLIRNIKTEGIPV
ncbi:nucleotidyltransferase domain-containing protein [Spirulina major CS-329]|uniref:nucleotidyltransferase domain-containing protein n=1 Tax=Spirulina TaxID=1154 RepID=UPI00232E49E4|nr:MULTISPECIES: nucleotidyltransferase domain-containing protein [Spirulina]MDB9494424.1 nucleotidyltransferase domain-containing protein [Spirulina subsalsa CS-330]MDB9502397.1 nucleotidyltransferase domain-containing protein [Spirulina major CS-329]